MSVRIARFFGWYLIAVALAVGVHFTVEFLYDSPPFTPHRIWFILDWFSLVGFLACIVANFRYKQSVRDEIATVSGENRNKFIEMFGEEQADTRLRSSTLKMNVVDAGELRPTIFRARKP